MDQTNPRFTHNDCESNVKLPLKNEVHTDDVRWLSPVTCTHKEKTHVEDRKFKVYRTSFSKDHCIVKFELRINKVSFLLIS